MVDPVRSRRRDDGIALLLRLQGMAAAFVNAWRRSGALVAAGLLGASKEAGFFFDLRGDPSNVPENIRDTLGGVLSGLLISTGKYPKYLVTPAPGFFSE